MSLKVIWTLQLIVNISEVDKQCSELYFIWFVLSLPECSYHSVHLIKMNETYNDNFSFSKTKSKLQSFSQKFKVSGDAEVTIIYTIRTYDSNINHNCQHWSTSRNYYTANHARINVKRIIIIFKKAVTILTQREIPILPGGLLATFGEENKFFSFSVRTLFIFLLSLCMLFWHKN